MSNTVTLNDVEKNISMTVATSVCTDDEIISKFSATLDAVTVSMPISTISLSAGVYTVTLKDARTYQVTIAAGTPSIGPGDPGIPPSAKVVSASFWTRDEVTLLQNLAAAINLLILTTGLSSMTVTYA